MLVSRPQVGKHLHVCVGAWSCLSPSDWAVFLSVSFILLSSVILWWFWWNTQIKPRLLIYQFVLNKSKWRKLSLLLFFVFLSEDNISVVEKKNSFFLALLINHLTPIKKKKKKNICSMKFPEQMSDTNVDQCLVTSPEYQSYSTSIFRGTKAFERCLRHVAACCKAVLLTRLC